MHYEPARETSGFPHSPFTSCCVPRPIGWISTVSTSGIRNIAPFSQFQNVTWDPPTVLFCSCGSPQTDTYSNAVETGEFVWNMATYDLRETVARTAAPFPPDVDEFDELGIETAPALRVKPPRVAASPVHFECVVKQVVDIPGNVPEANTKIVIGEVLVIHIADDALTDDGRIDIPRLRPLARLGYLDYTSVEYAWEQRARDLQTLHHHVEQPPEARIVGDAGS